MGDGMGVTVGTISAVTLATLFLGTVGVLGMVAFVLSALVWPRSSGDRAARALDIVGRRYAQGDIGSEEYRRIRADVLNQEAERRQIATERSSTSDQGVTLWAAGLSLAAGLIHLLAAPEHLQEWWGYGYFFIVVGIGQVLYGQLLFYNPTRGRRFYAVGLVGTLAIFGLYIVTRTVGIPWFGPAAGEVEPIGTLDVPSKAVELMLIGVLAALLRRPRAGASADRGAPTSVPPSPAPHGEQQAALLSRRRLLAALGGSVGVIGLATWFAWYRRSGDAPTARAAAGKAQAPVKQVVDGVMQEHLTVEEIEWELAPGTRVHALGYNGQVPGPEIRLREGQRLRVDVTNRLSVPTTIHWHGADVPNAMDGVPDLTQPPIRPGDTFVYEFDARPAGTRWYHTHFASTKQQDRGLYAPLIILPAQESNPPDREYTLVFSSWVTGRGKTVPAGGRGVMSGGGMMGSSGPAYDTFAVNGKAFPATAPLTVTEGERVRLRLINASGERAHLILLEGHRLRVTHTDGNALQRPVEVDVLPIAPAERYDVEFTADRPGVWSLHDLAPGQTEAGLRVRVVYVGHEGETEPALQTQATGLEQWSYGLGAGVDQLAQATGATRDFALQLSGGMMGSTAWTINGKVYPATDPLHVRQGDLVRVGFLNMSMVDHPFHLHGHSFRLTAIGGQALAAPLIKDVVDIQPMERASFEFVADNPGDWLLHCHKPMHMEGGMVALVRYQQV